MKISARFPKGRWGAPPLAMVALAALSLGAIPVAVMPPAGQVATAPEPMVPTDRAAVVWVAELLEANPTVALQRYREIGNDPNASAAERYLARARAGELAGWLGQPGAVIAPSPRRIELLQEERATPGARLDDLAAGLPDAPWAPWVDRTAAAVRNAQGAPTPVPPKALPAAAWAALGSWADGDPQRGDRILALLSPRWNAPWEPARSLAQSAPAALEAFRAGLRSAGSREGTTPEQRALLLALTKRVNRVEAEQGADAAAELLWRLPLPKSWTKGAFRSGSAPR